MQINTFQAKTLDNQPVQLISAVKMPTAYIKIAGYLKASVAATLPTRQAFRIFNDAECMTYAELRVALNV